MNLLVLAPQLPHAGSTGGHTIVYERVRRLAQRGHTVDLACFADEALAAKAGDLRPFVRDLIMLPPPPRRTVDTMLRSLVERVPTQFVALRSRDMRKAVGELVERNAHDVLLAEFSGMGQYLYHNPYLPAARRIVSCHFNLTSTLHKMTSRFSLGTLGLHSPRSIRSLQCGELDVFRGVDRVLVLTAQERQAMLENDSSLRVSAVSAGVDVERFQPSSEDRREDAIMFSGHYENLANLDAAMWFASSVWPLLRGRHPRAKLWLVGPGSTRLMRTLTRRDPSIVVTGAVPDIRDPLSRARVFVCPVRLGSGLRVKILEAMAMGVPLVTTTLGGAGLPLHPGDNAFIADTPRMIANYVDLLLNDDELRRSMGECGRALAEERFGWDRSIDQLEAVLRDIVPR